MSKGKKSERDIILDTLDRLSRERPDPNNLWSLILEAHDSLTVERIAAKQDDAKFGALMLAFLQATSPDPIPDATFVLTISAAVEQALELAISTHFVLDHEGAQRMFDDSQNGPLGTFAAKIKIAYALGIFTKEMKEEIDIIRRIRNAFAHSKNRLSFSSPQIAQACSLLNFFVEHYSYLFQDAVSAKSQFLVSSRLFYTYLEWPGSLGPMVFPKHPMYLEMQGRPTAQK